MKYYYSPSTFGFYSDKVHQGSIPVDAIEISNSLYRDLMDGQASGMRIVTGAGGVPELASRPEPDLSEKKEAKLIQLISKYDNASSSLLSQYRSEFERLSWSSQVLEASLVNASGSNGSNSTPFFDAFIAVNPDFAGEGSTDNENRALLKSVVESNNDQFASAAGDLTGQLSKKRHQILSSADEIELNSVDIEFVIPSISVEDKF